MQVGNRISCRPEVPEDIKNAVNNRTLAVFIGAGVSRLVGCDGWESLARKLVDKRRAKQLISYREWDTLYRDSDHKKAITICFHLLKKNNLSDLFYAEMKKALNGNEGTPNIYDDIYNLRGLFITTNADTHFDRLFNAPNILYRLSDFREDRLNNTNLYHIHGSIIDEDSLIFTVLDYMRRYSNREFRQFLNTIFHKYTVLFLGYGVAEFEILDFILQGMTDRSHPKHFMLSPYYSGEENILSCEQEYYNDLGINILGYEKDKHGYHQLIDVLRFWNEEIKQVTGYLHNASRLIDEAVK
jgi:hypothetical protein